MKLIMGRCGAAAFLQCWLLLRCSALASPFVIFSGLESLPDDDLVPLPAPPAVMVGNRRLTQRVEQPPLYVVSGPARAFSSQRAPPAATATVAAHAKPVERVVAVAAAAATKAKVAEPVASGSATPSFAGRPSHTKSYTRPAKCHDVRKDVVIESGFQGHADVFSEGRAASPWALASLGSPSSSNFVIPPEAQAGVFVVRTGKAVALAVPKATVSDTSVLDVEFSERQTENGMPTTDENPLVFVSRHTCKKAGIATVSIEMPLLTNLARSSVGSPCVGQPAPVVFAYQKACAPPVSGFGAFVKSLAAHLPVHGHDHNVMAAGPVRSRAKFPARDTADLDAVALAHRNVPPPKVPDAPWKGFIPSGGGRFILAVFLIILFFIVVYEFGNFWLSNKMKTLIAKNSPVWFGVEALIDKTAVSFWCGHFTYTITGLHFKNPADGGFTTPFFMDIQEVKVSFNMHRLLVTCGGEVEIRMLHARDVKANIEVDGYLGGKSNISAVLERMDQNNKKWVADLESIKQQSGFDAKELIGRVESKMMQIAERMILKEVEIENIHYSWANKALGVEMKMPDMEYHDFSEQNNAVGISRIGYVLSHAVFEGIAKDIGGVDFGLSQFDGLVNSIKGFVSGGVER